MGRGEGASRAIGGEGLLHLRGGLRRRDPDEITAEIVTDDIWRELRGEPTYTPLEPFPHDWQTRSHDQVATACAELDAFRQRLDRVSRLAGDAPRFWNYRWEYWEQSKARQWARELAREASGLALEAAAISDPWVASLQIEEIGAWAHAAERASNEYYTGSFERAAAKCGQAAESVGNQLREARAAIIQEIEAREYSEDLREFEQRAPEYAKRLRELRNHVELASPELDTLTRLKLAERLREREQLLDALPSGFDLDTAKQQAKMMLSELADALELDDGEQIERLARELGPFFDESARELEYR